MRNTKLFTDYVFDEQTMKVLEIPPVELIDNHPEVWRYCVFDRNPSITVEFRYMISSYGRLYDKKNFEMVNINLSNFFKSSVSGYCLVHVNGSGKGDYGDYFVHRLVMMSFTTPTEYKSIVNHIDGNPSHNYLWNLEWVTASENYIHALRTGLKKEPIGENRSNSLWKDEEIHNICIMMEQGHKATYIYNMLKELYPEDDRIQYERVRTLVKHIKHKTHWTHISKDYDIDCSKFNYAKEISSVRNAQRRIIEQDSKAQ